jgi:hypothetical protein
MHLPFPSSSPPSPHYHCELLVAHQLERYLNEKSYGTIFKIWDVAVMWYHTMHSGHIYGHDANHIHSRDVEQESSKILIMARRAAALVLSGQIIRSIGS